MVAISFCVIEYDYLVSFVVHLGRGISLWVERTMLIKTRVWAWCTGPQARKCRKSMPIRPVAWI